MIVRLLKDWVNPTSGLKKKAGLVFEVDNNLGRQLLQSGNAAKATRDELLGTVKTALREEIKLPKPPKKEPPKKGK
jgi:hypothetical protein